MRFRLRAFLQNDDAQVVGGEAGIFQRGIFEHGELLAVAGAGGKRSKRRGPLGANGIEGAVRKRPDRQVGRPVDMAEAGETVVAGTLGYNCNKLSRRRRPARLRFGPALRDRRPLGFDLRLQPPPCRR